MIEARQSDKLIIQQITDLLTGGNAHVTLEDATGNLSLGNVSKKPDNLPYSIWQLVEHIRITQWDIVEFSRDPDYQSPEWPAGYWPKEEAPANEKEWKNTLEQIKKDRQEFVELLNAPAVDLYTPFPHGSGQNLLREALLISDHTSYHLGQIILVRRLLNDWR